MGPAGEMIHVGDFFLSWEQIGSRKHMAQRTSFSYFKKTFQRQVIVQQVGHLFRMRLTLIPSIPEHTRSNS